MPVTPIEAIIHHGMVLVARLATADGRRAPLGAVPDRAFVQLSTALGERGLADVEIAALFGLSVGAWRARLRRRRAAPDASIEDALRARIGRDGPLTRGQLAADFAESALDPALDALVARGLVYRTGAGADARFGAVQPDVVPRAVGLARPYEITAVEHFAALVAQVDGALAEGRATLSGRRALSTPYCPGDRPGSAPPAASDPASDPCARRDR